MNMSDDAQKITEELEDSIRKGKNQKLLRYVCLLNGKIERKRENYSGAIEQFEKAISLLSFQWDGMHGEDHAKFFDSLANAYYEAGDLEKAREEYEKTAKLTTGRLWDGDIFAKSFYMLGKINEELGDAAKAIEHYEKFLDLWKEADPGLPEVDDARARLSQIKGSN
jgi:tetratricopeptide (TPR) repeat protein